jgi:hypothetical protein
LIAVKIVPTRSAMTVERRSIGRWRNVQPRHFRVRLPEPSAWNWTRPSSDRPQLEHAVTATSAQPFRAQPLDRLELEQRFSVLRAREMPLDPDEVLEANHAHGTTGDLNGLGGRLDILVGPDRLQIGEEVERVLPVNFECEVRAKGERLGIDADPEAPLAE